MTVRNNNNNNFSQVFEPLTKMPTPSLSTLLFSSISVIPDWISLHILLFEKSNGARILLWTSWTWILFRNKHFRINTVKESDEETHIKAQRNWVQRTFWKSVLLIIAVGFIYLDLALHEVGYADNDLALKKQVKLFIALIQGLIVEGRFRAELAFWLLIPLIINHLLWECLEFHILATKNGNQDSISKYIARDKANRKIKYILAAYLLSICGVIFWYEGPVYGTVFFIGYVFLIWVPTESVRADGDDLQTGHHSFGMILVLVIAIGISTVKHDVFWITKFASIFPYFFQFITSVPSHTKLKLRSEVKLFKHLCDTIAILFVSRSMTEWAVQRR